MTSPRQHSPQPEVELDPASEHVARQVGTGTSTALAATQHAMQSATLRAYLARDSASAETRSAQRALRAQQQLDRAATATERAATRTGLEPVTTAAHNPGTDTSTGTETSPQTSAGQWTAYRDGDPVAALGGTGVSVPPEQVLTHTDTQPTRPSAATPATAPHLGQSPAAEPATAPAPTTGLDR